MKAKASVVAQKLLNLYRQAHVIAGGWPALNKIFVDEATDDVIAEMRDLPTGKFLVMHIQNLRSGKTPMNSIARELLPYGGMLAESGDSVDLESDSVGALVDAVDKFSATPKGIEDFMNAPVIRDLGDNWIAYGRKVLATRPDKLQIFDTIVQTWNAYRVWDMANDILKQPISDRIRAQVQIDMPEYETYLPMFGDEGTDLLRRLHSLTSSLPIKSN
ncbi:MAG: hypothetical protein J6T57_04275 [Alphaproteobacteria bacterium]|nr:hypothetical protein [Alphaproteobacteria bacterium]